MQTLQITSKNTTSIAALSNHQTFPAGNGHSEI